MWMSHGTHMDLTFHTYARVTSRIWGFSHLRLLSFEWVMWHIRLSHVTHMNESCHTYGWVMSHTWMSHVTHMNESCHTYEWVMAPIILHKSRYHTATHCNTLQRNATHCNTLQRNATHCNTLKHTATCYNASYINPVIINPVITHMHVPVCVSITLFMHYLCHAYTHRHGHIHKSYVCTHYRTHADPIILHMHDSSHTHRHSHIHNNHIYPWSINLCMCFIVSQWDIWGLCFIVSQWDILGLHINCFMTLPLKTTTIWDSAKDVR